MLLFLNGTETVETLLLLLTRRLDRYGLRVNQKKTDLWTTGVLAQHRFIDIQALFGPKEKKRDPQVVLQFVQRYLNIPSEELARSWNCGMPLLNRLLYANLESLPPNLFVQILERLTSEKFLIAADFEKLMRIAHLCTRSPTPLDFGSQLDAISKSASTTRSIMK